MDKSVRDTQLYSRLLNYVVPYWRRFLIAIISMIILAATEPAIPALTRPLLNGAIIDNDPDTMVIVPILFVILFIVRGLATYISGVSLQWVSHKVIMDLRAKMFTHMLSFPSQYFDNFTTGNLMSKFTFDVIQIKGASTQAVTVVVKDSLIIIGLVGWMFYINWQLTFIALISTPFIVLFVVIIRRRLRKMGLKVQDSMGGIHHVLSECIDAQKVIKLYGGQQFETQRFNEVINNNRRFSMKFVMAAVATGPVVQLITAIVLAVIIFIASRQAAAGEIDVGTFVSFFAAMGLLMGPLKRLVRVNEHIQKGLAGCESIFSLLDEPVETDAGKKIFENRKAEIKYSDINFHYHGKNSNALTSLSLHISPGETVALVGPSGSGKTTVANLLPGFYEVSDGRIMLNGTDIREISLASLRNSIALVSQEVMLFNDTVRNNIAFGSLRDRDEEEILAAAKAAYAHDFIMDLPDGYDTVIGEKGLKLSGGQRQRLAIARAFLKDAPILIMDEATSSLDTESEKKIQLALEKVKTGRTCLIIAHRLSTIQNADRIIVIDQGSIVQTGTHDELLNQDGLYAKLH